MHKYKIQHAELLKRVYTVISEFYRHGAEMAARNIRRRETSVPDWTSAPLLHGPDRGQRSPKKRPHQRRDGGEVPRIL